LNFLNVIAPHPVVLVIQPQAEITGGTDSETVRDLRMIVENNDAFIRNSELRSPLYRPEA
jgi:hypothetical protein